MVNYKSSDVAITFNDNESEAVLSGLKLIKAEKLINHDDVVVLTPNWVNPTKPNPDKGVVVGPETLRTIIRWLKDLNPKRIVVATGSGNGNTLEVMKKVGYHNIINEEGVEFVDFNSGPYTEIEIKHEKPNKLSVNVLFDEMTKLVSFTQLKQHEESTMSAAIKNICLSWPSTEEHGAPKKNLGIHDDLHGFIVGMARKIPINISIVSANPVMVGTGPTKGAAYHTGLVIVGNNPLSVDIIGARLLGFKPQAINYLYQLEKLKMKETDVKKINLKGLSLLEAEEIFSQKVYNYEIKVDE